MNGQQVEARAAELFENGLHCAEAVLVAVLEGQNLPTDGAPRAASAFGAGVGRSKKGLCGALSGGLIALGLAQGRDSGDERWDAVAAKAEAVRAWFADEYGCTRCGVVLEKLGEQQGNGKCIALAGRTAARFHAVLNADAPGVAAACSCTASQRPAAQTGCGCR